MFKYKTRMLRLVTITWMLLGAGPLAAQNWDFWVVDSVDLEGETGLALALDSNDDPHIGFRPAGGGPDQKIAYTHMDSASGSFSTEYIFVVSSEQHVDITLDQDNYPHLTYHSHERPGGNDNVVHHYFDGVNWVADNIFSPGHDGWSSSIALDADGYAHISYIDPACCEGDSGGVEYAWYDGVEWQVESTGSESDLWIFHGTSLALDGATRPHISYYDDVAQNLMLAVRDTAVWTLTAVDTSGDVGRYSDLALDQNDLPHISYFTDRGDSTGIIRYAHFNGASWELSSVDTLDNFDVEVHDNNRISELTSIAIDANGRVHMAYADLKTVKLATFNGTEWEREIIADHGSSNLGFKQETSLALDSKGIPHVAYADMQLTNGGSPTLNLGHYAVKKPLAFAIDVEPLAGSVIHAGDTLQHFYTYSNFTALQQSVVVSVDMILPSGRIKPVVRPKTISLGAGTTISKNRFVVVREQSDPGAYSFVSRIGYSSEHAVNTDSAHIEVVAPDTLSRPAAALLIPHSAALHANYPNPFNPTTTIRYGLPVAGEVNLVVYDLLGQQVKQLAIGNRQSAGYHSATWNGTNDAGQQVASGIYIYRMIAGDFVQTRKMLLAR